MPTIALSDATFALLRHRVSTGDAAVTPANLDAYRELARAGIMVAGHSFTGGRESVYKFTEAGWAFANEPSPSGSASPRP